MVTTHVPVPLQPAPLHPLKVDPLVPEAVSVTTVPLLYDELQVPLVFPAVAVHEMPAGAEPIVPEPVPLAATVS
jgi:hypothetical protein